MSATASVNRSLSLIACRYLSFSRHVAQLMYQPCYQSPRLLYARRKAGRMSFSFLNQAAMKLSLLVSSFIYFFVLAFVTITVIDILTASPAASISFCIFCPSKERLIRIIRHILFSRFFYLLILWGGLVAQQEMFSIFQIFGMGLPVLLKLSTIHSFLQILRLQIPCFITITI